MGQGLVVTVEKIDFMLPWRAGVEFPALIHPGMMIGALKMTTYFSASNATNDSVGNMWLAKSKDPCLKFKPAGLIFLISNAQPPHDRHH